jgi:hypothetical protein
VRHCSLGAARIQRIRAATARCHTGSLLLTRSLAASFAPAPLGSRATHAFAPCRQFTSACTHVPTPAACSAYAHCSAPALQLPRALTPRAACATAAHAYCRSRAPFWRHSPSARAREPLYRLLAAPTPALHTRSALSPAAPPPGPCPAPARSCGPSRACVRPRAPRLGPPARAARAWSRTLRSPAR